MFISIQLVHFEGQWRRFGKPTHSLKRASVCPLCSDLGQSSAEGELPLTGIERSLDAPIVNIANVGEVVPVAVEFIVHCCQKVHRQRHRP